MSRKKFPGGTRAEDARFEERCLSRAQAIRDAATYEEAKQIFDLLEKSLSVQCKRWDHFDLDREELLKVVESKPR